jgi:hypothetical protein
MDTTTLAPLASNLNVSELKSKNLAIMVQFADRYVTLSKEERKLFEAPEAFWKPDGKADLANWMKSILPKDGMSLAELAQDCHKSKCQVLLKVVCSYLAAQTANMSVEEMRKFMNVEADLTPAEEEKIRKENTWSTKKEGKTKN